MTRDDARAERTALTPCSFNGMAGRTSDRTPDREPDRSIDQLADDIALLAAHIDAATCRLIDDVVELDLRMGWAHQGATCCSQWLGWRLGWERNTASEHLRVGHALRELPLLHEAFAGGRVSYSKIRAVTRVAEPDTDADWLPPLLRRRRRMCCAREARLPYGTSP